MRARKKQDVRVREVQRWFAREVTCDGEAYVIDEEQAAAVVDESQNTIVVARAGSGKTRTIVAKIIYLVARCGVQPNEIMTFVFNANAAAEINARLSRMRVNSEQVIDNQARIASTFHAFSRKIVYDVCDGREKCGKILAGEKEEMVQRIVQKMMREPKWANKIQRFVGNGIAKPENDCAEDINGMQREIEWRIEDQDLVKFAKMMTLFINRAQQKYLAGENTLEKSIKERLVQKDVDGRERAFIELGAECYRRYHWYLLKKKLPGFEDYGTDFNLLVSWASKLIASNNGKVGKMLGGKKYVLIDEYQDFSQLFLSVVLAIRRARPEVKLFVVGDDWQAINRFAGSDVEYFKGFERYFSDDCRKYEITTNYRCNYMIVGAARRFMQKAMKEKGKFGAFSRRAGEVMLVDPKRIELEYAKVEHDKRVGRKDAVYLKMTQKMLGWRPKYATVRYVKTLVRLIRENKKANETLLLHRNNETDLEGIRLERLREGLKWGLQQLGIMTEMEFDEKIRVMTMHKSKGLEAEVVILIEADEGIIPKTHPDTKLYGLFGETEKVAFEDQVRLFYVAMTRAKKRLYIIHDDTNGRGFVKYLGRGVEKWED